MNPFLFHICEKNTIYYIYSISVSLSVSLSVSADMKNIISVFYWYRPIRKLSLSGFIGIGHMKKSLSVVHCPRQQAIQFPKCSTPNVGPEQNDLDKDRGAGDRIRVFFAITTTIYLSLSSRVAGQQRKEKRGSKVGSLVHSSTPNLIRRLRQPTFCYYSQTLLHNVVRRSIRTQLQLASYLL